VIIYVAGKYRGATPEDEHMNVMLARGAAKQLWKMGYNVICPHLNTHEFDKDGLEILPDVDGPRSKSIPGLTWEEIMRGDLELVEASHALVMLPGWEHSEGAKMEYAHAQKLGKVTMIWPDVVPAKFFEARWMIEKEAIAPGEPVLVEAQRLISGVRDGDYGHPLDDFFGTAGMWTAMWWRKLRDGARFYPWDVPNGMNCVKLSREQNKHKRDNPTDGGGYWGTNQMVYDEIERRGLTVADFDHLTTLPKGKS
jgi:hypothetical protein